MMWYKIQNFTSREQNVEYIYMIKRRVAIRSLPHGILKGVYSKSFENMPSLEKAASPPGIPLAHDIHSTNRPLWDFNIDT